MGELVWMLPAASTVPLSGHCGTSVTPTRKSGGTGGGPISRRATMERPKLIALVGAADAALPDSNAMPPASTVMLSAANRRRWSANQRIVSLSRDCPCPGRNGSPSALLNGMPPPKRPETVGYQCENLPQKRAQKTIVSTTSKMTSPTKLSVRNI